MKKTNLVFSFLFVTFLFTVVGCKKDEPDNTPKVITISPGPNAADEAQLALIEAENNTTIIFEAGTFSFTNTLSMDGKDNIIIKGAGRNSTILDFSSQTSGGEGVLITNGNNIRIEGLTITDSEGDALKTRDCNRISFVDVATVWSGTPSAANGGYGLYPVLCTEVYIDNCYAYGASDAGIYVGQSDMVILKNSVAEGNVAGIEIENTTNADVFDNEAFDNTGGILVFDLPGLTQYGEIVRVFNNDIHDNNRTNFAPVGNIVSNVPAGTGFMILSTKKVAFFNNNLTSNNLSNILIASYLFINSNPNDPNYGPFPLDIYIHDNTYAGLGGTSNPTQPSTIQQIIDELNNQSIAIPQILMDGIILGATNICIQEPSNPSFVNLNALADMNLGSILTDISAHDCTKPDLPVVEFTPF